MRKKVLLILALTIVAALVVVLVIHPGQKSQSIQLPGIAGQQTEYYRIQLSGAQQAAYYASKGTATMPKPYHNKISTEGLPEPIANDIARSFPGYKVKFATMIDANEATDFEVVIVKGSRSKTLFYEVYEPVQAAAPKTIPLQTTESTKPPALGSFIVKKRAER